MHVAQKCAAVPGQRHASKQSMSPRSAQRFRDNDMHQNKEHVAQKCAAVLGHASKQRLEAHRLNPFRGGAL
jgi:hypothetical protein